MWSLTHQLFKLDGIYILQSGMSTGPIVKSFKLIEGHTPHLCSPLKRFNTPNHCAVK